MNLKRLQTFLLAADHKNFSTVAEMLGLSQPAISKQIKTLEEELGVELFHRDTMPPTLTEVGRLVYKKGKKLLEMWGELTRVCHAYQNILTGILRIGASTIPTSYILPSLLRSFREQYPGIEVQLTTNDSTEVENLVKERYLDVGIIGLPPKSNLLDTLKLAKDRLAIIGPPGHPPIRSISEITDRPFIFRKPGSGTWQTAIEGLSRMGLSVEDLTCVALVDSTEAILSMVQAGLGIAFISEMAARQAAENNQIAILLELPIERSFYLIYERTRRNQPFLDAFISHIKEKVSEFSKK
ncbi:LysR family transcriptional regulator [Collibacillus ludicampi]|uniref:LysR family transcriptional regulator n=1 Tax=Collibacillus ludicampi TaxID=2771369 RepID=A0AAV4LHY6_9BACL|nr:selenium metabolism-associated LysR family transcriptional regulator [Collibacillus ludicampi]GIM47328.1 LysR family transcriptional regulator [Collibacillus ludicampi]